MSTRIRVGYLGATLGSALAATLCLATAAAAGEPHCVRVGGTVGTNFTSQTTTLGTATGDLAGAIAATVKSIAPGQDNTTIFTVQHQWTTEGGDTILTSVAQATAAPLGPNLYGIVSYPVSITGGTGRFAGATGSLQNIGSVDFNTFRTVFRYRGVVCFR